MPKNYQLKINLVGTGEPARSEFLSMLRAIANDMHAGKTQGMWPVREGAACGSWILRDINED
jgi:hypothetical protein